MKVKFTKRNLVFILISFLAIAGGLVSFVPFRNASASKNKQLFQSKEEISRLKSDLQQSTDDLERLKSEDQYQVNQQLKNQIQAIQQTYLAVVETYEKLLKLKESSKNTSALDASFSNILSLLSKKDYSTASDELKNLDKEIQKEQSKLTAAVKIPSQVKSANDAPTSGYQRQKVTTSNGEFMVDIVAGDLSNTKVIVDTASESTCANNCPVLSLADYISRNGAFAGVNGGYFCPDSYPTCADKKNTFDTLLMNKNKVYFNSDNNVYSTVPAVIFGGSWVRFVSRSLDWGRDTGIDSMISNQPLLVSGGNISFTGNDDGKMTSKSNRAFVANKGNIVYIGVVYNCTVSESAIVMKTLGMENALNLDSGGSTAFWSGSYKAGPGRNLPNAVLFVKK